MLASQSIHPSNSVPSFSSTSVSLGPLPDSTPRSLPSLEGPPSWPRRDSAPSSSRLAAPADGHSHALFTSENQQSTADDCDSWAAQKEAGSRILELGQAEASLSVRSTVAGGSRSARNGGQLEDTSAFTAESQDAPTFIPPLRTSSRTPSRPLSLSQHMSVQLSTPDLTVFHAPSASARTANTSVLDLAPLVAQLGLLAAERNRLDEETTSKRHIGLEGRVMEADTVGTSGFEEFIRESFRLGIGEGAEVDASQSSLRPSTSSMRPPSQVGAPSMAAAHLSFFADLPLPRSRSSSAVNSLPFPLSSSSGTPPLPAVSPQTSAAHPRLPRNSNSLASLRSVDLVNPRSWSSTLPVQGGAIPLRPSSGKQALRIDIPLRIRRDSLPASGSRVNTPTRPELVLLREKNVGEVSSDDDEPGGEERTAMLDIPHLHSMAPQPQAETAVKEDDEVSSEHHYEGFEYAASKLSQSEGALSGDEDLVSDTEEEEEEEEDPDTHPLYTILATSSLPAVRALWDATALVLVPPRRSLPQLEELAASVAAQATPTSSPARGLGFEFVRGGKGVDPTLREREAEERSRQERERSEERQRLTSYLSWHCFRLEAGSSTDSGNQRWRSVGGGKDGEGGFVRVKIEPATGLAHVEWVLERCSQNSDEFSPPPATLFSASARSQGDTTPTAPSLAFPLIEPRISSDSEASSILPRTPPSPILSQPAPRIGGDDDEASTPTTSTKPPLELRKPVASSTALAQPEVVSLPRPTSLRALRILSETTIYRRPRPLASAIPATPTIPPTAAPVKTSKSAFRAPKWLRRGVGMGSGSSLKAVAEEKSRSASGSTLPGRSASRAEDKAPLLERVRVISVGGVLLPGWEHIQARNGQDLTATTTFEIDQRTSTINLSSEVGRRLGRGHSSTSLLLSLSRHASLDHPNVGGRRRAGSVASTRSTRSIRSTRTMFRAAPTSGTAVPSRDFLTDLSFFVLPASHLVSLAPILASTARLAGSLVHDFEGSFAYIKGFDVYTLQRIRKGIFDKAWSSLSRDLELSGELGARLLSEERTALSHILENVVMGLLHSKLYTASIRPLYTEENARINHILHLYRSRQPQLTPADLGVDVCDFGAGQTLAGAVGAMRRVGRDGALPSQELVQACASALGGAVVEETMSRSLAQARTPLGCIGCMRQAIEEIVEAVKRVEPDLRVAPDDLIPLLAWVTVKSEVEDLESLLYYVKTFRLSDDLAAEFDWSFVTFQASLAFLLSDPLKALEACPLPRPSLILPFPPSASPASNRRASELPSFRPRRSSVHQHSPYATAEQRLSPPSSPRSPRVLSSSAWTPSPSARGPGRSGPFAASVEDGLNSSSAGMPARERRLSWQHATRSQQRRSSVSPSPSGTGSIRMTASEEMPPPSWTISKHQRRQSLGVLPSAANLALGPLLKSDIPHSLVEDASSRSHTHALAQSEAPLPRPASVATSSPAQELQIRPRIVLPPRSTHSSFHRSSTPTSDRGPSFPPLIRSHSSMSSRKIGPESAAVDMRRSESEGSPTVKRVPAPDSWSLWGGSVAPPSPASSERATSPDPSERAASSRADDNSWWNWGRERLISVGPVQSTTAGLAASSEEGGRSEIGATPGPRARRHSASAVDLLNFGPRTLSLPLDPPSSSSARLAAILAARSAGAPRPPRPRSIMSISSMSSLDSATSHATSAEDYLIAASTLSSSTSSLPVPSRRKITKSRTWRELPTSNLVSKPLVPQLDSSSVISFPAPSSSLSRTSSSHSASSRTSALPSSSPLSPRLVRPGSPIQRRHTEL